ncbi:MAG: nucleotidyltransferase domain-containing protein [Nitrososphaerota archaeon]|jgi:predicted nucleotidyltransferase|nr:nucleotidyltransferase domain-containing protein [Nitrososphaerota archaeon]
MPVVDDDMHYRVTREAAALLYFGVEKEYKQAKLKAAEIFNVHFLPTNLEIAMELDKIADEKEGSARKECLILMRQEALKIMKLLAVGSPLLVGSVWRGTNRFGSDIDIAVYADLPELILEILTKFNINIQRSCWTRVNKQGITYMSYHIYAETETKNRVEIVVRGLDEAGKPRKCEIFGDEIKGLKTIELEKLLKENPTKQFLP